MAQRTSVADLISQGVLFIGDGYRTKLEELSNVGLPFARAGDIDGGFHFDGVDRFPEENLHHVGNKVSAPGDVVFTSKGTVGRFALVRETTPRFVYSPQLCFWRVLNPAKIDPQFLFYWMSSREFYTQFKGVAGQTDMAEYVSLGDQRRMHITLPDIDDQKAIGNVLSTLDAKIELNRRMNETLDSIGRAIFKFRFVETVSAHPASSVGNEFKLTMGQAPPGENYNEIEEGLPFFQGRADFGFRYPQPRVYCSEPTRIAERGDTLVSVRAPVGEINLAKEHCCIGRGVAAVRHRSGSRSYTYYCMQSLKAQFETFEAEGTVFGSIGKDQFKALKVPAVPENSVQEFDMLISPLDHLIELNESTSSTLADLRDLMLPRLLTGKLRIEPGELSNAG